jgi:MEDS: MEthanogen/methylotroph, DcmR Sensory domain
MDPSHDHENIRDGLLRERHQPIRYAGSVLAARHHLFAFFHSHDEEYRALLPFIRESFERGEKACHIVDPDRRDGHLQRLTLAGIDVAAAQRRGQLELRGWADTYLRDGRFDQHGHLALLEEILQGGPRQGFLFSPCLAHMEWALQDKPGLDDLSFVEFETRVNHVSPKYDDPLVCAYDPSKFSSGMITHVMRTHPVVLIGGVLQENPFFVPPDQFLLELRERRSVRRSASLEN